MTLGRSAIDEPIACDRSAGHIVRMSEETDYGDFQPGGDPLDPDAAAHYVLEQRRLNLGIMFGCLGLILAAIVAAIVGVASIF